MPSVRSDELGRVSGSNAGERDRLLVILEIVNASLAVMALVLGLAMGSNDRPLSVLTPASLRAFGVVSLLGLVCLWVLQNRGRFLLARVAAIPLLILEVLSIAPIVHVVRGWAILGFALPILAASLLLTPVMSFPCASLCAVISMLVDALMLGHVPDPLPAVLFFLLACVSWLGTHILPPALSELRTRVRTLEEHAVRSQAFFEHANDAIFVLRDGRFVDCNPKALEMFAASRDDMMGRTPADFSPPRQPDGHDSKDAALDWIERALRGESQMFDWLHVRRDGTPFDAEMSLNAMDIGSERYVEAIVRDVTERKRAEAALRESQRRLFTLMSNLPGMAYRYVYHPSRNLEFASEGAEALTGYPAAQLMSAQVSYAEMLHPDDRVSAWNLIQQALSEGHAFHITYRLRTRDGDEKWIREQGRGVVNDRGEITHVEGFAEDITARRHTLEALRASESAYRSVYDTAPSLIATIARDGTILACNPRTLELLGYGREEIQGRSIFEHMGPTDRARGAEALDEAFTKGRVTDAQFNMIRRGGKLLQVVANMAVLRQTTAPPCAICILSDVSERNRLEQRLRQAQRLEAVGKLAGGIAHDFNNILSIIGGYCDFALATLEPGTPAHEYVEEIRRAGERARDLTRQLLAFSRRQVLQLCPLDLNEVIRRATGTLTRIVGQEVELSFDLADDLRVVNADATQIGRVLANLVINARDAMPDGGSITISTRNVTPESQPPSQNVALGPGCHVMMSVSDTGPGIPPEVMEHLFEPFYTTKAPGKGTGLGLATVYGIVRQLGGIVCADSGEGEGATFHVYLPSAQDAATLEHTATIAQSDAGEILTPSRNPAANSEG